MKFIYPILLLLLLSACKDNDDYFYQDTPETLNQSMWDYLKADPNLSYYTDKMDQTGLDSLYDTGNTYTIFLTSEDEFLKAIDSDSGLIEALSYQIIPTNINVQSVDDYSIIKTVSEKYALIENDQSSSTYSFDGIQIAESGPQFLDGRYYILESCVIPAPNLYEYLYAYSSAYSNFVDAEDSIFFDIDESTPIGTSAEGTVYDSIFDVFSRFADDYYDVTEDYRNQSATMVVFSTQQYEAAIDYIKTDLKTDEIPDVWVNEVLMPTMAENNIFNNTLQFEDFEERMVNINGDSISVDISNINSDSRTICSNGVAYMVNNFVIPDTLYKSFPQIDSYDFVTTIVEDQKWAWGEEVSVTGLEGTDYVPQLQANTKELAANEHFFTLELDDDFDVNNNLRITIKQSNIFGAENFRLIWGGTSTICGLWKIYINDEPVQMRTYSGKDSEYFDSNLFKNKTIKSITGMSNFKGDGTYNLADFEIHTLTEFTDVEITFEYHGPSESTIGTTPGIVIDYLQLEIY